MNRRAFYVELKRCNAYRVAVAYAVMGWQVIQIATAKFAILQILN